MKKILALGILAAGAAFLWQRYRQRQAAEAALWAEATDSI